MSKSNCFKSNVVSGEPSPTNLLSIAINKRRALMSQKNRDYHRELLINSSIQRLCKHIGEQRAQRKRRSSPDHSQSSIVHSKHSRPNIESSKPLSESQTVSDSDQKLFSRSIVKPKKRHVTPSAQFPLKTSDKDPFGLDDLFKSLGTGAKKSPALVRG